MIIRDRRRRYLGTMALILILANGLSVAAGTSVHALSDQTSTPTWDNTATDTPVPLPDVVVAEITTVPSPPFVGQPTTVLVRVRNRGSAKTTMTCWTGLYIDRAPVGEPSLQMFAPALGQGHSTVVSYTIVLADVGYHALTAWVDFLEDIPEEDEDNNQYSRSVLVVAPTASPTPLPTAVPRPGEPVNLVYNGDFENGFVTVAGLGEVADGCIPFVETEGVPQFVSSTERTRGQRSQRVWSDWVPFRAGIYQRVVGITPGTTYRATAEMLSIVEEGGAAVQGRAMGKQIGLDPWGGGDPSSPDVIWSDANWEDRAWQEGDQAVWVSAVAETGVMTLFLRVDNAYAGHNDLFYVDHVTMHTFLAVPTATPPATDTPTATPPPSLTASPSPQPTRIPSANPLIPASGTGPPSPTIFPVKASTCTPLPVATYQGRSPVTSISSPMATAVPAPSTTGPLIPRLLALALGLIAMLTVAILWLQRSSR